MVLLLERENGTPPLSHHDQWRRGFACKTDADCSSAPALDEPCSPIGLAGTGAIPEPEMNSRFFFAGSGGGVDFLKGIPPQRGLPCSGPHHCLWLPSLSWLILLGSWDLPGVWIETGEYSDAAVQAFFMPFASRFCRITQLPQYFRGSNLNIPYYATSILGFEVFYLFFLLVEKPGTVIYSKENTPDLGGEKQQKNNLISLLFAASHINPQC